MSDGPSDLNTVSPTYRRTPTRSKKKKAESSDDEPIAKRSRSNSRAKAAEAESAKRSRSNSKAQKAEPEVAADGPLELFVKGLSFDTDENGLRTHFEQFGELTKCKLIMKQGKSAGIAFVEYGNPAESAKALADSNGAWLDNRQIWVEFSG